MRGVALMLCPYCGSEVGKTSTCDRCGPVDGTGPMTGWRPDPTARHEGRYYVAGRPTGRVRNGKAEKSDPDGGRMLPGYVELPASSPTSIRSTWLGPGVATAVILLLGGVVWGLVHHRHPSPPPDTEYLSALKNSGMDGQFNSDANAVAHGRAVCRQLEDGGPQQGPAVDKIAVDVFCRQFSQGFHILETATVSGTFVLTDTKSDPDFSSIASDGTLCEGTNGYADIDAHTPVAVTNGKGETLATTSLQQGHGGTATCTFAFSFSVTEGQDRYVVTVGHRGDFSYTFNQLQQNGVEIHLGH